MFPVTMAVSLAEVQAPCGVPASKTLPLHNVFVTQTVSNENRRRVSAFSSPKLPICFPHFPSLPFLQTFLFDGGDNQEFSSFQLVDVSRFISS